MKKIIGLILSLTIISAVCASVLAYINKKTLEPIAQIKETKKTDSAKIVMPNGVSSISLEDGVFIGKNESGEIIGYALEGADSGGYGGEIILMVGFEKDKKTIVCYKPLVANETPGLGSKLSDENFISQFKGKKGGHLRVKKDGGEIDAITSATITSRAVCNAIGNARKKLKSIK